MTTFERQVADAVTDPGRLTAVSATELLDTVPDEAFDLLTTTAAQVLDAPYAFVTIVDDHRSYWKSCVGLGSLPIAERQNKVEESFCQYVIGLGDAFMIDDARLDPRTRDNPAVDGMGVVAWAGQPIMSADGYVLGSFCVMDTVPREWSARDQQLLAAFAGSASREVQLWTRLLELEALRRRSDELSAFTAALGAHITTDAALELMVSQVPNLLGTDLVTIATITPGEPDARVHHSMSVSTEMAQRFATLPIDVPTPLTDAIRTGELVVVADRDEGRERYPHLDAAARSAGVVISAAIPLRVSGGTVIGALGVAWKSARVIDGMERTILESVASLCAQTIERTRLADTSLDLSTALTRQLLPEVVAVDRVDIAVRYLPADDRLAFGGDWYDVVVLDDSRVLCIVGDVVGHGVEAAARMAELRVVLHTLASQGVPLDELLGEADVLLEHLHERYLATVALVEIDIAHSTLRHVSGGHPPILVRDGQGRVDVHEGAKRPPLGFGAPATSAAAVPLEPGSVVVIYSDGLVERRGTDLDDSIASLASHFGGIDAGSSEEVCDQILASRAAKRRDDIAVVVVTT